MHGRILQVRNIDAIDGTPVIDIKPVITSLDTLSDDACTPITYVLHLVLPRSKRIRIGKLGYKSFAQGHYYYIGSATSNLSQRIARHYKKYKKRFWHIDYLRAHAKIKTTYTSNLSEEHLVRIFEILCPGAIMGFGASDTSHCTHLFFSPSPIETKILPYTVLTRL